MHLWWEFAQHLFLGGSSTKYFPLLYLGCANCTFPTHLKSYKCLGLGKANICKSNLSSAETFSTKLEFTHWVYMMPVGIHVRELPWTDVLGVCFQPPLQFSPLSVLLTPVNTGHSWHPAERHLAEGHCGQALHPQSEWGKPATTAGDWILEDVQCHKWPLPRQCWPRTQSSLLERTSVLLPALGAFQLHCDLLDFTNSGWS